MSIALTVSAAVVVIHLVALPFGISSVRAQNTGQAIARSWVSNFRKSLDVVDRTRWVTVIPLTMPPCSSLGSSRPSTWEAEFFPLLPDWHAYDTGPVEVAGPTGALLPASAGDSVSLVGKGLAAAFQPQGLQNLQPVIGPPGSICYQGDGSSWQLRLPLPTTVHGGVVADDVSLISDRPLTMNPLSIDGTTIMTNELPVTAPAGSSRLLVALSGISADQIGFTGAASRAHFCLTAVQVGTILVTSGVKGTCNEVNAFGMVYGTVDCGVPWRGSNLPSDRK